ncbi:galactose mutarotase-like protein [Exidia glandulosa HHB12029]|uniref:Galactose mutarotase-like protein n=1 Tax=Exidia glandulosa HHB12029 TaxID=1314781 RepID=A0A165MQZ4_EXIGL|nr:galactose mutarotase-like protein [Exidia glandulosa HHB12029]
MMLFHALALFAPLALAAKTPGLLEPITIVSPDASAKATFIRFGATLTSFWTRDKFGAFRDIHLGFDETSLYESDAKGHPYFGAVVGRYANRIKNGTFTLDGKTFNISKNEHDGLNTLHGGFVGYDRRNWTVSSRTASSVSFSLVDPSGTEGFPGTVKTTVTYTLSAHSTFHITMKSSADTRTPIMLSGHHYWNLEAYAESQDLVGHVGQWAASKVIDADSLLIPTGDLIDVTGNALDFRKATSVGVALENGVWCGPGCTGFDNAWVYDNNDGKKPIFSLWSVNSGIRMDVTTNQPALQIYTCNGIWSATNPIPRKKSQGKGHYVNHSCIVVEQESWIDAINNPQWGIDQIYGPGKDYVWDATYAFSVVKH